MNKIEFVKFLNSICREHRRKDDNQIGRGFEGSVTLLEGIREELNSSELDYEIGKRVKDCVKQIHILRNKKDYNTSRNYQLWVDKFSNMYEEKEDVTVDPVYVKGDADDKESELSEEKSLKSRVYSFVYRDAMDKIRRFKEKHQTYNSEDYIKRYPQNKNQFKKYLETQINKYLGDGKYSGEFLGFEPMANAVTLNLELVDSFENYLRSKGDRETKRPPVSNKQKFEQALEAISKHSSELLFDLAKFKFHCEGILKPSILGLKDIYFEHYEDGEGNKMIRVHKGPEFEEQFANRTNQNDKRNLVIQQHLNAALSMIPQLQDALKEAGMMRPLEKSYIVIKEYFEERSLHQRDELFNYKNGGTSTESFINEGMESRYEIEKKKKLKN